MTNGTYRALIGEQSYDFAFQNGQLLINDTPVAYTFDHVSEGYYTLLLNGRSFPFVVEEMDDRRVRLSIAGHRVEVHVKDEKALLLERFGLNEDAGAADRRVHAPMPGLVLNVMVQPGQQVRTGDSLLVLEAMKMENELRAATDGVIKTLHVAPGDAVGKNALLLELEA